MQCDLEETVDSHAIGVQHIDARGGDRVVDAFGCQGVAIGNGAQGGLGNSSIEPRRQLDVYILAMTVEITDDIMFKAGISDEIGYKSVLVKGIAGGPRGGGGGNTQGG